MAGYTPKLVDTGLQHWIKANLALSITKDGITDAVCNTTNTFHQDALKGILTPKQIKNSDLCTQCTIQNILPCRTKVICIVNAGGCSFHQSTHYRPCPKHICDQLKDKIRKCHKFNTPSWKNTRPERWCQNPWELAKCYFPPDGYNAVNTIEETDLNGILSLLLNHTAFKRIVDEKTCEETREIGRRLRHSPSLCIHETDMKSYLDTLVRFLSNSSLFQADSKATESVQKLKQLKADSLTIASEDVTKVLQDVIQEATRGSVEEINEIAAQRAREIKTDLDKLEIVRSTSLKDILTAKTSAISDIDRSKHASISEIDKNKESAISEIDMSKDVGISEIGNCKDHAISEIDKKVQTGVEDIKLATEQLKLEARYDTKLIVQHPSKEVQQGPAMITGAVYHQLKSEIYLLNIKKMERSLVFDTSVAKDILTKQALNFCLTTGLLVQNKVPGQFTARDTRISFSHKTFQEVFAALYIQSQSDPSEVIQQVLVKCHNVEKILEISNVLIFLSGLSHTTSTSEVSQCGENS